MLENRDYMRLGSSGFQWSATVLLLLACIVIFFLQWLFLGYDPPPRYLALSLDGLRRGYVWELISYQFLHGGWLHLLLNGWALYVFGRAVESTLGKGRFLVLYFMSGIVGGLFQVLAALVWPMYFGGSVVGASASVFGVVAAFAMLFPHRVLTLLLFFIIPVNLRARTLLLIMLAITALGISFPLSMGGNVAHAAHLGGILTGLAMIRWGDDLLRMSSWRSFSLRGPAQWPRPNATRPTRWQTPPKRRTDMVPDEFISREVDPILDKISEHGIHSLTEQERKILEAARSKMVKH